MCFFSTSKMITPAKRGSQSQGIFLLQRQVYYIHTLQSERFPWRITAESLLFGSIVTSIVGENRAILLQHFKVLVVDWCFNLTRSLYVLWFCIVKTDENRGLQTRLCSGWTVRLCGLGQTHTFLTWVSQLGVPTQGWQQFYLLGALYGLFKWANPPPPVLAYPQSPQWAAHSGVRLAVH